jgi:hypothetical protein
LMMPGNEERVGEAWKISKIKWEKVFLWWSFVALKENRVFPRKSFAGPCQVR